MKNTIKIMVLGLIITCATFQAAERGGAIAPQSAQGIRQHIDSGVGNALHYAGTGLAVAGLTIGTYQLIKALGCWIAACQACNEEDSAELREQRNKSLALMLAGFSTAGIVQFLKNTDTKALIMHIDLGAMIAAIINALAGYKRA